MGYALVKVADCEDCYDDHFSKVIFASRDKDLVVSEMNRLLEQSKRYKDEHSKIKENNTRIVYKYKNELRDYLISNIDRLISPSGNSISNVDIEMFLDANHRSLYNLTRQFPNSPIFGQQITIPVSLFDGIPEVKYEQSYPSYEEYYYNHELEIVECEVA